ncbi:MAG: amino acid permease [Victivallales bacterium]|nr:amino acid permease [Victivallales bacterium]
MSLRRSLQFFDVFSISTGAMISSGIFILPGVVFPYVGPALFISYFLAGIIAIIGILNVIELTTAMPKAGGAYYFVTRSMGPLVGTISGILSWLALIMKSAFAVFGMSEVIHVFFPAIPVWSSSIILTMLFILFNLAGVKAAAALENFMVIILLVTIGFFVIIGLPEVHPGAFKPLLLPGKSFNDILLATAMVYISYGGLLHATSISEEVKSPSHNIPLGIVVSVLVTIFLYVAILIIVIGVTPSQNFVGDTTSVADAAKIIAGMPGYAVMTLGAVMAFTTTAHGGLMSASRFPFALSRDGLMPSFVAAETVRRKTPWAAILITGIIMGIAAQMPLETLVKAASAVILTSYVLAAFAVIILRESRVLNYRPTYKVPFYPFFQLICIIVFSIMFINLGWDALRINLVVIALSILIYYLYGRKTSREFTLLHLLERITNRKLTGHGLEKELLEVVRHRDEIIKDEFDHQVERSGVLDMEGTMCTTTLFRAIADKFAPGVNMDPDRFYELLMERENTSSTAINHFVAIPHLILEGEGCFQIELVRCKDGAAMEGANGLVKAVFVILGTRDCRNYHLKALAAIAQIVQGNNFESRWLAARDCDQLRDILLLGKRKRTSNNG